MITHARTQKRTLPTIRQLKLLPLRALISLAARCVKRARAQYASGRLDCAAALDRAIRAATAFAADRSEPIGWRDVKRAVLYASNANAESVAIAVEHLASAVANAELVEDKPARAQHVLRQVHQAIEAAHDACFEEEFIEMAIDEYFRLQRISKQHRFPSLGPTIDAGPNGPLGPEWPIWETQQLLR